MFHEKNSKKIKLFIDLKPIDWVSFSQIYVPILGFESSNLYMYIFSQKQILNNINIDKYNLSVFLENINLNEQKFKCLLSILEKYNLAKLSINNQDDESTNFLLQIFSPLSIEEALKNFKINEKINNSFSKEKISEFNLLTERSEFGYEVELSVSESGKKKQKNEKNNNLIIGSDLYFDFYNWIFQKNKKTFDVSDDVLELIKIYHLEEKKISWEKILKFAFNSLKSNKDQDYICFDSFDFLINSELKSSSPLNKKISNSEYSDFWKNFLNFSTSELQKKFEILFSNSDSLIFYKKTTNKNKAPAALEKWVTDCVKNKNFEYKILNSIISFVQNLLKKIPINYLIKMSDSLFNNDCMSVDSFLAHIKCVIEYDLKNKNRLKIKSKNYINQEFKISF